MGVRVWGVVEDRLIEVRVEPTAMDPGIQIVGLPDSKARTTQDRVRAALVNSGLVREAPSVTVVLEPAVPVGKTSDLDLPIALAACAGAGVISSSLRWIMAAGRLGLDGMVHSEVVLERVTLTDVVESLCRTPVV